MKRNCQLCEEAASKLSWLTIIVNKSVYGIILLKSPIARSRDLTHGYFASSVHQLWHRDPGRYARPSRVASLRHWTQFPPTLQWDIWMLQRSGWLRIGWNSLRVEWLLVTCVERSALHRDHRNLTWLQKGRLMARLRDRGRCWSDCVVAWRGLVVENVRRIIFVKLLQFRSKCAWRTVVNEMRGRSPVAVLANDFDSLLDCSKEFSTTFREWDLESDIAWDKIEERFDGAYLRKEDTSKVVISKERLLELLVEHIGEGNVEGAHIRLGLVN